MGLFEELAVAIITAFQFGHYVTGDWKATFFIEMGDVVYVMHVHDETAHLFRDFGFGIPHVSDDGG